MLPLELLLIAGLAGPSIVASQPTEPQYSRLHPSQAHISSDQQGFNVIHQYQCFGGHIERYPSPSTWLAWSTLWNINRETILSTNGGNTYLQHHAMSAILQVAEESGVDPRLILVLVMQETNAQADAGCTGSVPYCGIMHAPKGHRFDRAHPQQSVVKMIREGVKGSPRSGLGFAELLAGRPVMANVPKGNAYAAARAYNSGVVGQNLDEAARGQRGYVNNVANRLLGWDGRGQGFEECS